MKPTIFSNGQAVMKTISSLVLALATVCAAAAQTPLRIGFVDPALPKNPPPRNAAALAFAQSQGEVARIAWQTTGGWLAPDGKICAPEEFDVVWFHQGDDLGAAKLDAAAGADLMAWLEGGGTLLVSGAAGSVLNDLGIEPTPLRVLGASGGRKHKDGDDEMFHDFSSCMNRVGDGVDLDVPFGRSAMRSSCGRID